MKITVKIEGQPFEVEINDLYQRPVIATIDGEAFEVWPEGEEPFKVRQLTKTESAPPLKREKAYSGTVKDRIVAPIPGVIESIHVKAGEEVAAGQASCVLEAMKMKNTIRSPRPGRIGDIKVKIDQQVGEGEDLVSFESD